MFVLGPLQVLTSRWRCGAVGKNVARGVVEERKNVEEGQNSVAVKAWRSRGVKLVDAWLDVTSNIRKERA